MKKKEPNICGKKEECCGCTACATVCPRQAITFEYDDEGFLYPQVDYVNCVGCLKCEDVCAFKNNMETSISVNGKVKVFATKAKDKKVVASSSSGGMFTVLSDVFLDRGDIVVACKYSYETDSVVPSIITDKKSRDEARGSKYIQAELGNSYRVLIDLLKKNVEKKAIVFGTGCQIAGLDLVLKSLKLRNRVILVDLICHGATSSNLWKNYIHKIERMQGDSISYITFKDKRNGWEAPSTYVMADGNEISIKPYSDWFYMGLSLRESCYKCPYTQIDRNSDITIGDYWGIQNSLPQFYDRMGVSLVIIHTEAGMELFDDASYAMDYQMSNRKSCVQPRLVSPPLRPKNRTLFWNDMQEKGLDYCIDNYVKHNDVSIKDKMKEKILKHLKNFR